MVLRMHNVPCGKHTCHVKAFHIFLNVGCVAPENKSYTYLNAATPLTEDSSKVRGPQTASHPAAGTPPVRRPPPTARRPPPVAARPSAHAVAASYKYACALKVYRRPFVIGGTEGQLAFTCFLLSLHVDRCLINKRSSCNVHRPSPPFPQYNVETYTFLPGCEIGINKRPLTKTWTRKSTGSTLYWGKGGPST